MIIGGEPADAHDILMPSLNSALQRDALPFAGEHVTVRKGQLGERAVALGAVATVLHAANRLGGGAATATPTRRLSPPPNAKWSRAIRPSRNSATGSARSSTTPSQVISRRPRGGWWRPDEAPSDVTGISLHVDAPVPTLVTLAVTDDPRESRCRLKNSP